MSCIPDPYRSGGSGNSGGSSGSSGGGGTGGTDGCSEADDKKTCSPPIVASSEGD